MQIWVDADACPGVIREILYRAADRTGVLTTLVANQPVTVRPSPHLRFLHVAGGFDVADDEIVRRCEGGDVVITSDIPLAAEVVAKGCAVLSFRGERYTKENIGAKLNMRDFLDTMRSSGNQTGGPAAFSKADRQEFANQLDRLLARRS